MQALIETAAGLARVAGDRAAPRTRLDALILGYADLAASLGRSAAGAADLDAWRPDPQEAVLLAARAHGLQAIDGPLPRRRRPTRPSAPPSTRARDLGFDGKWAIHPAQVAAAQRGLHAERGRRSRDARAVIAALAAAEREGGQGAVALDGQMLDEAVRSRRCASWRALARRRRESARDGRHARHDAASRARTSRTSTSRLRRTRRAGAHADRGPRGRCTRRSSAAGCGWRSTRRSARRSPAASAPLAHPALVCDVAIGQSTLLTQRVIANLFYRGLVLRRAAADRRHAAHDDRGRRAAPERARGPAARRPASPCCGSARSTRRTARCSTSTRCAMLPLRDPDGRHRPRRRRIAAPSRSRSTPASARGAGRGLGPRRRSRAAVAAAPALRRRSRAGDALDGRGRRRRQRGARAGAAERSTSPTAHHDARRRPGGPRLVYGGHTIGLAAAQLTRALPDLVDDRRLARLRPPRAGVRGRHAHEPTLELERSSRCTARTAARSLHLRSRVCPRAGATTATTRSTCSTGARRGALACSRHPRRPARRRGLGVRRGAARRDDARAARRRRDPLRPDRRRPGPRSLAARRERRRASSGRA